MMDRPITEAMERMTAATQRMTAVMRQLGISSQEAAEAFRRLAPVLREAYHDLEELAAHDPGLRFRLWVVEQPRWQRPLMRLAFRIERWVLRG